MNAQNKSTTQGFEFTCHFHAWRGEASRAEVYRDPFEARLAEACRSHMFGRVVPRVFKDLHGSAEE